MTTGLMVPSARPPASAAPPRSTCLKPPSTLVADDAVAVTPVDCAPSLAAAPGVTSECDAALSSTQSTRSASELLESSRRRPKYDLSVTDTPAPMPPCAAVHCSSGIGWPAVVAASGTELRKSSSSSSFSKQLSAPATPIRRRRCLSSAARSRGGRARLPSAAARNIGPGRAVGVSRSPEISRCRTRNLDLEKSETVRGQSLCASALTLPSCTPDVPTRRRPRLAVPARRQPADAQPLGQRRRHR